MQQAFIMNVSFRKIKKKRTKHERPKWKERKANPSNNDNVCMKRDEYVERMDYIYIHICC